MVRRNRCVLLLHYSVVCYFFLLFEESFLFRLDFFGSAPVSPELRGMIEVLCRGRPRWLAFNAERIRAAYARPPGQNHAAHIGYGANRPSIYVRVYVIFIVKLLM